MKGGYIFLLLFGIIIFGLSYYFTQYVPKEGFQVNSSIFETDRFLNNSLNPVIVDFRGYSIAHKIKEDFMNYIADWHNYAGYIDLENKNSSLVEIEYIDSKGNSVKEGIRGDITVSFSKDNGIGGPAGRSATFYVGFYFHRLHSHSGSYMGHDYPRPGNVNASQFRETFTKFMESVSPNTLYNKRNFIQNYKPWDITGLSNKINPTNYLATNTYDLVKDKYIYAYSVTRIAIEGQLQNRGDQAIGYNTGVFKGRYPSKTQELNAAQDEKIRLVVYGTFCNYHSNDFRDCVHWGSAFDFKDANLLETYLNIPYDDDYHDGTSLFYSYGLFYPEMKSLDATRPYVFVSNAPPYWNNFFIRSLRNSVNNTLQIPVNLNTRVTYDDNKSINQVIFNNGVQPPSRNITVPTYTTNGTILQRTFNATFHTIASTRNISELSLQEQFVGRITPRILSLMPSMMRRYITSWAYNRSSRILDARLSGLKASAGANGEDMHAREANLHKAAELLRYATNNLDRAIAENNSELTTTWSNYLVKYLYNNVTNVTSNTGATNGAPLWNTVDNADCIPVTMSGMSVDNPNSYVPNYNINLLATGILHYPTWYQYKGNRIQYNKSANRYTIIHVPLTSQNTDNNYFNYRWNMTGENPNISYKNNGNGIWDQAWDLDDRTIALMIGDYKANIQKILPNYGTASNINILDQKMLDSIAQSFYEYSNGLFEMYMIYDIFIVGSNMMDIRFDKKQRLAPNTYITLRNQYNPQIGKYNRLLNMYNDETWRESYSNINDIKAEISTSLVAIGPVLNPSYPTNNGNPEELRREIDRLTELNKTLQTKIEDATSSSETKLRNLTARLGNQVSSSAGIIAIQQLFTQTSPDENVGDLQNRMNNNTDNINNLLNQIDGIETNVARIFFTMTTPSNLVVNGIALGPNAALSYNTAYNASLEIDMGQSQGNVNYSPTIIYTKNVTPNINPSNIDFIKQAAQLYMDGITTTLSSFTRDTFRDSNGVVRVDKVYGFAKLDDVTCGFTWQESQYDFYTNKPNVRRIVDVALKFAFDNIEYQNPQIYIDNQVDTIYLTTSNLDLTASNYYIQNTLNNQRNQEKIIELSNDIQNLNNYISNTIREVSNYFVSNTVYIRTQRGLTYNERFQSGQTPHISLTSTCITEVPRKMVDIFNERYSSNYTLSNVQRFLGQMDSVNPIDSSFIAAQIAPAVEAAKLARTAMQQAFNTLASMGPFAPPGLRAPAQAAYDAAVSQLQQAEAAVVAALAAAEAGQSTFCNIFHIPEYPFNSFNSWSGNVTYNFGDTVKYNSFLYTAVRINTNVPPDSSNISDLYGRNYPAGLIFWSKDKLYPPNLSGITNQPMRSSIMNVLNNKDNTVNFRYDLNISYSRTYEGRTPIGSLIRISEPGTENSINYVLTDSAGRNIKEIRTNVTTNPIAKLIIYNLDYNTMFKTSYTNLNIIEQKRTEISNIYSIMADKKNMYDTISNTYINGDFKFGILQNSNETPFTLVDYLSNYKNEVYIEAFEKLLTPSNMSNLKAYDTVNSTLKSLSNNNERWPVLLTTYTSQGYNTETLSLLKLVTDFTDINNTIRKLNDGVWRDYTFIRNIIGGTNANLVFRSQQLLRNLDTQKIAAASLLNTNLSNIPINPDILYVSTSYITIKRQLEEEQTLNNYDGACPANMTCGNAQVMNQLMEYYNLDSNNSNKITRILKAFTPNEFQCDYSVEMTDSNRRVKKGTISFEVAQNIEDCSYIISSNYGFNNSYYINELKYVQDNATDISGYQYINANLTTFSNSVKSLINPLITATRTATTSMYDALTSSRILQFNSLGKMYAISNVGRCGNISFETLSNMCRNNKKFQCSIFDSHPQVDRYINRILRFSINPNVNMLDVVYERINLGVSNNTLREVSRDTAASRYRIIEDTPGYCDYVAIFQSDIAPTPPVDYVNHSNIERGDFRFIYDNINIVNPREIQNINPVSKQAIQTLLYAFEYSSLYKNNFNRQVPIDRMDSRPSFDNSAMFSKAKYMYNSSTNWFNTSTEQVAMLNSMVDSKNIHHHISRIHQYRLISPNQVRYTVDATAVQHGENLINTVGFNYKDSNHSLTSNLTVEEELPFQIELSNSISNASSIVDINERDSEISRINLAYQTALATRTANKLAVNNLRFRNWRFDIVLRFEKSPFLYKTFTPYQHLTSFLPYVPEDSNSDGSSKSNFYKFNIAGTDRFNISYSYPITQPAVSINKNITEIPTNFTLTTAIDYNSIIIKRLTGLPNILTYRVDPINSNICEYYLNLGNLPIEKKFYKVKYYTDNWFNSNSSNTAIESIEPATFENSLFSIDIRTDEPNRLFDIFRSHYESLYSNARVANFHTIDIVSVNTLITNLSIVYFDSLNNYDTGKIPDIKAFNRDKTFKIYYYKEPTTLWDSTTDYMKGNIIIYNSLYYIARFNNANVRPDSTQLENYGGSMIQKGQLYWGTSYNTEPNNATVIYKFHEVPALSNPTNFTYSNSISIPSKNYYLDNILWKYIRFTVDEAFSQNNFNKTRNFYQISQFELFKDNTKIIINANENYSNIFNYNNVNTTNSSNILSLERSIHVLEPRPAGSYNNTWRPAHNVLVINPISISFVVPTNFNGFSFTTGKDIPKNPKKWRLEASTDNSNWLTLKQFNYVKYPRQSFFRTRLYNFKDGVEDINLFQHPYYKLTLYECGDILAGDELQIRNMYNYYSIVSFNNDMKTVFEDYPKVLRLQNLDILYYYEDFEDNAIYHILKTRNLRDNVDVHLLYVLEGFQFENGCANSIKSVVPYYLSNVSSDVITKLAASNSNCSSWVSSNDCVFYSKFTAAILNTVFTGTTERIFNQEKFCPNYRTNRILDIFEDYIGGETADRFELSYDIRYKKFDIATNTYSYILENLLYRKIYTFNEEDYSGIIQYSDSVSVDTILDTYVYSNTVIATSNLPSINIGTHEIKITLTTPSNIIFECVDYIDDLIFSDNSNYNHEVINISDSNIPTYVSANNYTLLNTPIQHSLYDGADLNNLVTRINPFSYVSNIKINCGGPGGLNFSNPNILPYRTSVSVYEQIPILDYETPPVYVNGEFVAPTILGFNEFGNGITGYRNGNEISNYSINNPEMFNSQLLTTFSNTYNMSLVSDVDPYIAYGKQDSNDSLKYYYIVCVPGTDTFTTLDTVVYAEYSIKWYYGANSNRNFSNIAFLGNLPDPECNSIRRRITLLNLYTNASINTYVPIGNYQVLGLLAQYNICSNYINTTYQGLDSFAQSPIGYYVKLLYTHDRIKPYFKKDYVYICYYLGDLKNPVFKEYSVTLRGISSNCSNVDYTFDYRRDLTVSQVNNLSNRFYIKYFNDNYNTARELSNVGITYRSILSNYIYSPARINLEDFRYVNGVTNKRVAEYDPNTGIVSDTNFYYEIMDDIPDSYKNLGDMLESMGFNMEGIRRTLYTKYEYKYDTSIYSFIVMGDTIRTDIVDGSYVETPTNWTLVYSIYILYNSSNSSNPYYGVDFESLNLEATVGDTPIATYAASNGYVENIVSLTQSEMMKIYGFNANSTALRNSINIALSNLKNNATFSNNLFTIRYIYSDYNTLENRYLAAYWPADTPLTLDSLATTSPVGFLGYTIQLSNITSSNYDAYFNGVYTQYPIDFDTTSYSNGFNGIFYKSGIQSNTTMIDLRINSMTCTNEYSPIDSDITQYLFNSMDSMPRGIVAYGKNVSMSRFMYIVDYVEYYQLININLNQVDIAGFRPDSVAYCDTFFEDDGAYLTIEPTSNITQSQMGAYITTNNLVSNYLSNDSYPEWRAQQDANAEAQAAGAATEAAAEAAEGAALAGDAAAAASAIAINASNCFISVQANNMNLISNLFTVDAGTQFLAMTGAPTNLIPDAMRAAGVHAYKKNMTLNTFDYIVDYLISGGTHYYPLTRLTFIDAGDTSSSDCDGYTLNNNNYSITYLNIINSANLSSYVTTNGFSNIYITNPYAVAGEIDTTVAAAAAADAAAAAEAAAAAAAMESGGAAAAGIGDSYSSFQDYRPANSYSYNSNTIQRESFAEYHVQEPVKVKEQETYSYISFSANNSYRFTDFKLYTSRDAEVPIVLVKSDVNSNLVHNPRKLPITGYSFITNTISPNYDPKEWVLKGTNDGRNWEILDSRKLGKNIARGYQLPLIYLNGRTKPLPQPVVRVEERPIEETIDKSMLVKYYKQKINPSITPDYKKFLYDRSSKTHYFLYDEYDLNRNLISKDLIIGFILQGSKVKKPVLYENEDGMQVPFNLTKSYMKQFWEKNIMVPLLFEDF
jgi:hypothetical protein